MIGHDIDPDAHMDDEYNIVPAPSVADVPAQLGEAINIYRRGRPLPQELRARVMLYLQQGLTKQSIASRLAVSRSTVLRYQKAASDQGNAIPNVKPRGGYRSAVALLNREQVLKL